MTLNGLAVLTYLVTLLYIIKRYPRYAVLFGYVSFMQAWALISCWYNDTGIYNVELFRFTEQTWATARLAGFYIVFNLGFLLAARFLDKRRPVRYDYSLKYVGLRLGKFKLFLYAALVMVGLAVVHNFLQNGVPLLQGTGRFAYLQEAGALDRVLITYGPLLAFALGLWHISERRRYAGFCVLLLFVVYAVLVGHKFSFLMILLVCYLIPILARRVSRSKDFTLFRWRYVLVAGSVCAVFLLFAVNTYYRVFGDLADARELLIDRVFAMQGEIWWAVDYDYFVFDRYDPDHWLTELDYCMAADDVSSADVGLRYLMLQVIGPDKSYAMFDRGYLYTMAYPAILVATFPYLLAVLLQLAAGITFVALIYYLHYSLIYKHYLRALVAVLIVMPFVTTILTGNLFVFLSAGMIFKALLLLLLESGLGAGARKAVPC